MEYLKQLFYAIIGVVLSGVIPLLMLTLVVKLLEKTKTDDNTKDS